MSMLPIGCATLPADHVACAYCGTPTTGPTTEHIVSMRIVAMPGGTTREEPVNGSAEFGMCDTCRERRDLAGALLDAHPAARYALGTRAIALHQISGALDALAILGVEAPRTFTTEALADLVRLLAPHGIMARWSARFSPVLAADASQTQAAAKPWQHVRVMPLRDLRQAYSQYLAHRLPPRMIPCPTGGCMVCGVSAVFARRVDEPWKPATMSASVLRGPNSASGHLCPTCSEAQYDAGPHVLDAALLEAIDPTRTLRRKQPEPPRFEGISAWTLTGRKPSAEPFGWVNLDDVRKSMAAGGW